MNRMLTVAASLALAMPAAAQTASLTSAEVAAWREDLRVLAAELPARHPNAFYRTPRARFDSAVAALNVKMPAFQRHEAVVGLMQIVALVRDGHTSLQPAFETGAGFHYFPIELYLFKDGLFIKKAGAEYSSLAGAKVLRIGTSTPDAAVRLVGTAISNENEYWVKLIAPFYLTMPEVLHALGISPDLETLTLQVDQGGAVRTVTIRSAGVMGAGNGHAGPVDRSGWTDMRKPGDSPLYMQQPDRLYWMRFLPDSRTLYVAYRSVAIMPDDPLPRFFARVFAAADSLRPDRLVLDMRDNGGGNNFFNKSFVQGVIRRPWLDQPGKFYAIIGRRTFSAAQNMVNDLERWTNVTFVGEPTGNAPNQYGDARPFTLPNSGLRVNISSVYWQTMNPQDPRVFVPPAIGADLSSADYRDNVDPVMRAILRLTSEPSVTDRMAAAVATGDTVLAEGILREAGQDPENTWRNLESEVNTLGYNLLGERRMPEAVSIFAINIRVYPNSPNAWDSYGEGLENSGRREEAIASYRRALTLDPRQGSSRDGLTRLGAQP